MTWTKFDQNDAKPVLHPLVGKGHKFSITFSDTSVRAQNRAEFREVKLLLEHYETDLAALWVQNHVHFATTFDNVPGLELELDASLATLQIFEVLVKVAILLWRH